MNGWRLRLCFRRATPEGKALERGELSCFLPSEAPWPSPTPRQWRAILWSAAVAALVLGPLYVAKVSSAEPADEVPVERPYGTP